MTGGVRSFEYANKCKFHIREAVPNLIPTKDMERNLEN